MATAQPWHDDERFWALWRKWSFGETRWEAASVQVDQIIALAGLEPGMAVLDLCCGPGRHSLELQRRGFQVTGVDRNEAYIAEARQRSQEAGLEVEFAVDDMRTFRREAAFDAAINLWTAFGYFEDDTENQRVLENLSGSLKPGGPLVMELAGKETVARKFQARDWTEEADGVLLLQERTVCRDWSWMANRWIYIDDEGLHEFSVNTWLYSAKELADMTKRAGFSEAAAYGSCEGVPYDQKANRLVLVARKREQEDRQDACPTLVGASSA